MGESVGLRREDRGVGGNAQRRGVLVAVVFVLALTAYRHLPVVIVVRIVLLLLVVPVIMAVARLRAGAKSPRRAGTAGQDAGA